MSDPMMEEIWRVREELLKKYGGFDGYVKHLQEMDRVRERKKKLAAKPKRRRPTARKPRTSPAKSS